jgi:hypothetical protein
MNRFAATLTILFCTGSLAVHPLLCVVETKDMHALENLKADGLIDLVVEDQTLLDLAIERLSEADPLMIKLRELGAHRANELQGDVNTNVPRNHDDNHPTLPDLLAQLPQRALVAGGGEALIQLGIDAARAQSRMGVPDLKTEMRELAEKHCNYPFTSPYYLEMLDLHRKLNDRHEIMTMRTNLLLPTPDPDHNGDPWYVVREAPRDAELFADDESSDSEEEPDTDGLMTELS